MSNVLGLFKIFCPVTIKIPIVIDVAVHTILYADDTLLSGIISITIVRFVLTLNLFFNISKQFDLVINHSKTKWHMI